MAVMISIQPKWCKKIMSGEKTLEVRKTRPKIETPFKCYIYCTSGTGKNTLNIPIPTERLIEGLCETGSMKSLNCPIGNQKVIGEFICDAIDRVDIPYPAYQNKLDKKYVDGSCVPYCELHRYAYHDDLYFWHISDLKIYNNPMQLSQFENGSSCLMFRDDTCLGWTGMQRPPQSWCYVEELTDVKSWIEPWAE